MKMSLLFNNSMTELLNNNYFLLILKSVPKDVPKVPTRGPEMVPYSEKLANPKGPPSGLCWTLMDLS